MNYILEFQEKYKIPLTGTLDRKTLLKMKSVWGISNNQLTHVLANVDNETGNFTVAHENLNYSSAGLAKTWPSRYSSGGKPNALAKKISGKPELIANYTYANRYGNGTPESGDGWRFRGRGGIQLTFKDNYKAFSKFVQDAAIMTNPDLVATKYFWESAIFFFTHAKLWGQMLYSDPASIKSVRKVLNGGYIGLSEVQEKFKYYSKLLSEL